MLYEYKLTLNIACELFFLKVTFTWHKQVVENALSNNSFDLV